MDTLLIILALLYLPGCFVVWSAAGYRGLNASAWFFAAIIATPLIAMLGVLATPQDFDREMLEAKWEKVPPRPQ